MVSSMDTYSTVFEGFPSSFLTLESLWLLVSVVKLLGSATLVYVMGRFGGWLGRMPDRWDDNRMKCGGALHSHIEEASI